MTQLVSILIPCYNAASYVGPAIESALGQTWKSKEIVVVDDGGTDASGAIIDSYRDAGINVVHQSNEGQSAAANRAFRESTGAYVKFFDADDLMHPTLVERQMERLNGSITAVASAEWGRFYDDDPSTFGINPEAVCRDMPGVDWLVEAWRDARPMMQCGLWLLPRPLLEAAGMWNEQLSLINDFEFFARVLVRAEEVKFTRGAPLYYRSGLRTSLSGRKSRAAVESAYLSLTEGTKHLLLRRNDAAARLACANMLQDFIYTYYPNHPDLRAKLTARIDELGGSDLQPDGPPGFQRLRRVIGWKCARRVQRLARR